MKKKEKRRLGEGRHTVGIYQRDEEGVWGSKNKSTFGWAAVSITSAMSSAVSGERQQFGSDTNRIASFPDSLSAALLAGSTLPSQPAAGQWVGAKRAIGRAVGNAERECNCKWEMAIESSEEILKIEVIKSFLYPQHSKWLSCQFNLPIPLHPLLLFLLLQLKWAVIPSAKWFPKTLFLQIRFSQTHLLCGFASSFPSSSRSPYCLNAKR